MPIERLRDIFKFTREMKPKSKVGWIPKESRIEKIKKLFPTRREIKTSAEAIEEMQPDV